jgi:SAM-dependent methyltransferase
MKACPERRRRDEGRISKIADQQYLLTEQYKDASNLKARIDLHRRFSVNAYGWHLWVFDQIRLAPDSRVLELGCGPGRLWSENIMRTPVGWDITLSDFSPGMLQEAQYNLADHAHRFRFEIIDAQSIPFELGRFDAVIANHMLYHVPDRAAALSEIRRVLKPGGRLYATTVGESHLSELTDLAGRFDPSLAAWGGRPVDRFTLESGGAELAQWFSTVTLRRYDDALNVTQAEPLTAYILSYLNLSAERRAELGRFVEQELARHGSILITKDSGIFEAWRY